MKKFKLEKLWAFTSIDPTNGSEGLMGATMGETFMPLVCGDEERLNSVMIIAKGIARQMKRKIIVKEFHNFTEYGQINAFGEFSRSEVKE